jgi:hypothetical protein
LPLLRALADAEDVPVDDTEVDGVVDGLSYESLMRTLGALACADFIEGYWYSLINPITRYEPLVYG